MQDNLSQKPESNTDQPVFRIKHRFTGKILFELQCKSLKICIEAALKSGADLSGADLSGADLYGANLYGANGEKTTIKYTPLQISGLRWPIIIFDKDMKIGYEYHSISNWWSFDDDRISKMESDALDFWKANKPMLQALCAANGRE